MSEEGHDRRRGLLRQATEGIGAGGKGKGPIIQHELGIVVGGRLNPQVAEHGVGFPASKELDGIFIYAGAEEGGSTAWSQASRGEEAWVDVVDMVGELGSEANAFRCQFGVSAVPLFTVLVVVPEEFSLSGAAVCAQFEVLAQVDTNPPQGFDWA